MSQYRQHEIPAAWKTANLGDKRKLQDQVEQLQRWSIAGSRISSQAWHSDSCIRSNLLRHNKLCFNTWLRPHEDLPNEGRKLRFIVTSPQPPFRHVYVATAEVRSKVVDAFIPRLGQVATKAANQGQMILRQRGFKYSTLVNRRFD